MKLTIISSDNAVYKDGLSYSSLNLSSANIPADVHALQWDTNKGHIEFINNVKPNEIITELPSWANDALTAWQQAYEAEQAAIAKLQEETTGT